MEGDNEMMSTRIIMKAAIVRALEYAKAGAGEFEQNNRGPDIYRFRRGDGTGKRVTGAGDWCAAFASCCIVEASKHCLSSTPFETSRGARRLVKNAAAAGREKIGSKAKLRAGDQGLISWKRRYKGKWHPWKGHVGFVVDYCPHTDTLYTVEGNHRKKGEKLAKVSTFEYPNGSWRKRLDRVVVW